MTEAGASEGGGRSEIQSAQPHEPQYLLVAAVPDRSVRSKDIHMSWAQWLRRDMLRAAGAAMCTWAREQSKRLRWCPRIRGAQRPSMRGRGRVLATCGAAGTERYGRERVATGLPCTPAKAEGWRQRERAKPRRIRIVWRWASIWTRCAASSQPSSKPTPRMVSRVASCSHLTTMVAVPCCRPAVHLRSWNLGRGRTLRAAAAGLRWWLCRAAVRLTKWGGSVASMPNAYCCLSCPGCSGLVREENSSTIYEWGWSRPWSAHIYKCLKSLDRNPRLIFPRLKFHLSSDIGMPQDLFQLDVATVAATEAATQRHAWLIIYCKLSFQIGDS
jgi:hypothetical protein